MRYVIAYDVADDSRRTRVAKILESIGERVQGSVFETDLNDKALARLQERLAKVVDTESDGIRFYQLCGECAREVRIIGQGKVVRAPDVLII
jgi:CRISPR-associated protein Cas2